MSPTEHGSEKSPRVTRFHSPSGLSYSQNIFFCRSFMLSFRRAGRRFASLEPSASVTITEPTRSGAVVYSRGAGVLCSSLGGRSSNSTNSLFFGTLVGAAATAAAAFASNLENKADAHSQDGDPPGHSRRLFSLEEAKDFLPIHLEDARSNFGKDRSPAVRLSRDQDSLLHQISFGLPTSANWLAVIAAFSDRIIGAGGSVEFHSGRTTAVGALAGVNLEVRQSPGSPSCSVMLSTGAAFGGSFALFRDKGFTELDLNALCSAYAAALSSAKAGNSTSRSTQLPGAWRGRLGPSSQEDAAQEKPANKQEALAALEKLGLEVYNPDSGDQVDWDSLAGCNDLRDEIEGTVVLALQDGAAFDAMARKTRARYESNRYATRVSFF